MRRIIIVAVGIAGCWMSLAAGCGPLNRAAGIDPLARGDRGAHRWDTVLAAGLGRPHDDVDLLRARYAGATDPLERRRMRDGVAYATLALIEEHHARSGIAMATLRSTNDTLADVVAIGLGTAATLTGGESAKSALAAAASAVTGANLSINQNLLRDQATSAVVAQMDADHVAARNELIRRLRELDDDDYPLAAADLDLIRCLYAGSPVRAVSSLAEAATMRRAAAESEGVRTLMPR